MAIIILTLLVVPFVLAEDSVDVVYANHRYFGSSPPTLSASRTFQKSALNHLTQRPPVQVQRRIQQTLLRNVTESQPSRLALAKRSGDYHYYPMDYPQYEIDEHAAPHAHHVPAVRTVPYPRYPVYDRPSSRVDFSSLGIIAILKLIILKILSFGVFKLILLLLLKFPIILFILGFKFLIILKLIKLVKLLTIPIIIPFVLLLVAPILIIIFVLLLPLLLPLILAPIIPLILIPILLPLLLSLPVPVLAPTGRRRRQTEDLQSRSVQEDVLYLVRRVLESEQCIERVACQFAANKQSQGFATFVAWYLEKAAGFVNKPRFTSYKDAYKRGTTNGVSPQHCARLYACNNPRNAL